MAWEVQTVIGANAWRNTWIEIEQPNRPAVPVTFDTEDDARQALRDHLREQGGAIRADWYKVTEIAN